jgi:hypothetical protein
MEYNEYNYETMLPGFMIHWLDGSTTIVHGNDIADACNRNGIGSGALPAMDYYEPHYERD